MGKILNLWDCLVNEENDMYDLSIELPTAEIENLFCDFDDDHAAVPSTVVTFYTLTMSNVERQHAQKQHDRSIDCFVNIVLNKEA